MLEYGVLTTYHQHWQFTPNPSKHCPLFISNWTMNMHPKNSWWSSKKQTTPCKPDFVCVGGWYRVGQLLGSGGSGVLDSNSRLTYLSDFYRECLSRKRYQDRSWCCSEGRASKLLTFKAYAWIQCVWGSCWQHGYLFSPLVWQRGPIRGHHPELSWDITWWFD